MHNEFEIYMNSVESVIQCYHNPIQVSSRSPTTVEQSIGNGASPDGAVLDIGEASPTWIIDQIWNYSLVNVILISTEYI